MSALTKISFLLCVLINSKLTLCGHIHPQSTEDEVISARSILPDCDGVFSFTCMKINFIHFIESVSKPNKYELLPGLILSKEKGDDASENSAKIKEIARAFPNDPEERIDSYLMYKVEDLLEKRSIKFNLVDDRTVNEIAKMIDQPEVEEGRKIKKKKKKLIFGVLAAAKIIKGLIGAKLVAIMFLILKKALITSTVALIVAIFLAIKTKMGENSEILKRIGKGRLDEEIEKHVNIDLPEHLKRNDESNKPTYWQ